MKIKRPKNIKNLTQNSIRISLRKTATLVETLNLAQELKTEPLVPICWTSSIVTLPLSLSNLKFNNICHIKTSTLEETTTTVPQTHMITVANLEAWTVHQETKAQLRLIHQSSAKLQYSRTNIPLRSKSKPSTLHASTQRVQCSCQV